ncbi:MAG: hypothetical protein ABI685_08260 [Ferruginibacter sp.]
MNKIISILMVLFLPVLLFAQISKYQGKYHATSFSISGGEKMKTDFEVKADGTLTGNFTIGDKDEIVLKDLQGKANGKGKFEAQVNQADGTIFSINGYLPFEKEKSSISFVLKKIVTGNGSKRVSETGATGFIMRLSEAESAPEIDIVDEGKTYLLLGGTNLLFSDAWWPVTSTFTITSYETNTFKTIEIKDESGDFIRHFRFALTEQPGKNTWLASEGFAVSYKETKATEKSNYLIKQSGKIELVSEDDKEIVFKITNLQLKKLVGENIVRIDGYVHAAKIQ